MRGTFCKIELPNLSQRLAELGALSSAQKDALAAVMRTQAELVMLKSKRQVPVDTGALRSTGHVRPPQVEGDLVSVEMGYGGPAGKGDPSAHVGGEYHSAKTGRKVTVGDPVGYGFYVHENLSAHHEVGKAKFLEEPLTEQVTAIEKALIEALDEAIHKTFGS